MADFLSTRSFLSGNLDGLLENLNTRRQAKKIQADDLFGDSHQQSGMNWKINYELRPKLDILSREKESLGLYVSGNPLEDYRQLQDWVRLQTHREDIVLILANKVKKIFTKANTMMFAIQVSTVDEEFEAVVFPKLAPEVSPILEEKEIYWVRGKISRSKKKKEKNPTPSKTEDHPQPDTDNPEAMTTEPSIQEYEELPKILVEALCKFEDGVLPLFKGIEDLAINRQKTLQIIHWDQLKTKPWTLAEAYSPKTKPVTQSTQLKTETGPIHLHLKRSLGATNLKQIRLALQTKPTPDYLEVIIHVEGDQGFKRVKGTFWAPKDIVSKIQNT